MPERERQLWVLVVHQNWAGDTALHTAACAGSLRGVKGVYRLFHGFYCLDVDETYDPDSGDLPVEYWDWVAMKDDRDDGYSNLPTLDFVCTKAG